VIELGEMSIFELSRLLAPSIHVGRRCSAGRGSDVVGALMSKNSERFMQVFRGIGRNGMMCGSPRRASAAHA
jgi:hypothetical protein